MEGAEKRITKRETPSLTWNFSNVMGCQRNGSVFGR